MSKLRPDGTIMQGDVLEYARVLELTMQIFMQTFLMVLGGLAFAAFLSALWLSNIGISRADGGREWPPVTISQNWLIAAILAWLASAAWRG